jgi:hypothetical protein
MTQSGNQRPANVEVDRKAITSMLMKLFDLWELTTEEQLVAMGLTLTDLHKLDQYREGEPITASDDSMKRAGHLLGIHRSLRLLFPHDRAAVYRWIKTPNSDFENLSPVAVIGKQGIVGLQRVTVYLARACSK